MTHFHHVEALLLVPLAVLHALLDRLRWLSPAPAAPLAATQPPLPAPLPVVLEPVLTPPAAAKPRTRKRRATPVQTITT